MLCLCLFLSSVAMSVLKMRDSSVGVVQGAEREDALLYPSVTLCPIYNKYDIYRRLDVDALVVKNQTGLTEDLATVDGLLLRLEHTYRKYNRYAYV